MGSKTRILILVLISAAAISLIILFVLFPILQTDETTSQVELVVASQESTQSPTIAAASSNINPWFELQNKVPVPHTTPLPESKWTPIDGTYAKLDPSLPQWWACRRCADYRPAGGIWKLRFDQGVMRIYYPITGWRSVASYTVPGDQLQIFNDPYCPQEVGIYRWKLEDEWNLPDRKIIIEVDEDPCSINLRGENFSNQAWYSCMPPNEMTGASNHWHKPPGCEENPIPPEAEPQTNLQVNVNVHPGYTRDFVVQPDVYADANSEENPSPEGINVTHSEESISYGLNRVLWGVGDWVQASTDLPFETMGVQIYGDHTIGWARVLLDGEEVWRGDTAAIWSHLGRHGGYIEISGYDPGRHTIRVESMGFDYHPVTVAFFGFSEQGGIEMGERQ
jgi:hypothetical protein